MSIIAVLIYLFSNNIFYSLLISIICANLFISLDVFKKLRSEGFKEGKDKEKKKEGITEDEEEDSNEEDEDSNEEDEDSNDEDEDSNEDSNEEDEEDYDEEDEKKIKKLQKELANKNNFNNNSKISSLNNTKK